MLKSNTPYVIVVNEDGDLKEDIINLLASEGCLVNGFSSSQEALRFLRSTYIIPSHIVLTDGTSLLDDLEKEEKWRSLKLITTQNPLDMKKLIASIGK